MIVLELAFQNRSVQELQRAFPVSYVVRPFSDVLRRNTRLRLNASCKGPSTPPHAMNEISLIASAIVVPNDALSMPRALSHLSTVNRPIGVVECSVPADLPMLKAATVDECA